MSEVKVGKVTLALQALQKKNQYISKKASVVKKKSDSFMNNKAVFQCKLCSLICLSICLPLVHPLVAPVYTPAALSHVGCLT